jgi:serine phosphatase RsbU (regulator of sigma subunit)
MIARKRLATPDNRLRNLEISKAVYATDGSTGGDRIDAFEGADGRVHLIVLDACGHGIRSEPLADMILHTMRTLLWQGLPPARVFASLNRIVLDLSVDKSVTSTGSGAIVSLESNRASATFASAGHVDVLRFSPDGRSHYHLSPTGPLFGVTDDAQYFDETVSCRPGSTFVLVTDGLIDARPIDGSYEFLGTSGICRILREVWASPGGISAARVVSRVRKIAGGGFQDDVAAMIVTSH